MISRELLVVAVATSLVVRTISAAPATPKPPELVVGEPAPQLVCEKYLHTTGEAGTSPEALRGKVAVVVFWATWCGPCVRSIPAINELENAHKDDPVVFIHITDEEESVITPFLKKHPINGWVGIDTAGTTFKNYGIKGRPSIAVIGKDGAFLGWSDPRVLAHEPETLREVLATGSSEGLSSKRETSVDPLEGIARDTATRKGGRNLCDIVIRRSDESSAKRSGGGDSRGDWTLDRPLLTHLAHFCDVQSPRIVDTVGLPEEHYDIIALAKNLHTPAMQEAVCQLIGATFDLSFVREKRLMDVSVLKPLPGREPTLTPSWGGVKYDAETHLSAPNKEILERMKNGENYYFTLTPLAWLPKGLAHTLKRPVVLELGDMPEEKDGVYSFCFPFPKDDTEAFLKAFEKNVGLTLESARRTIEVFVIAPVGQSVLSSDE